MAFPLLQCAVKHVRISRELLAGTCMPAAASRIGQDRAPQVLLTEHASAGDAAGTAAADAGSVCGGDGATWNSCGSEAASIPCARWTSA